MLKSACLDIQDFWSAPGIGSQVLRSNCLTNLRNWWTKIDVENKELYLLGDVNCNLLAEATAHISSSLTSILDIYGLSHGTNTYYPGVQKPD